MYRISCEAKVSPQKTRNAFCSTAGTGVAESAAVFARREKTANRLKKVTAKDLEKYDEFFEKLGSNGKLVTAGSSEIINRNRDMFTMILDPFSNK